MHGSGEVDELRLRPTGWGEGTMGELGQRWPWDWWVGRAAGPTPHLANVASVAEPGPWCVCPCVCRKRGTGRVGMYCSHLPL